jgi:hypothetical protein
VPAAHNRGSHAGRMAKRELESISKRESFVRFVSCSGGGGRKGQGRAATKSVAHNTKWQLQWGDRTELVGW